MTSLFISHSSRDQVAAQRVHRWLRNAGYQALFLDFDPSDGIPAGRRGKLNYTLAFAAPMVWFFWPALIQWRRSGASLS